MNMKSTPFDEVDVEEAAGQLAQAVDSKKCWSCGCFHTSLAAVEKAIPPRRRSPNLESVLWTGRQRLSAIKYDCLGCRICHPALALNDLNSSCVDCEGLDLGPAERVEERKGWPPLPGSYTALRYHAPVAVCSLTDETVAQLIAAERVPGIAIVGTLQTENLGIERLTTNVIANPHLHFLLLCGQDSRQAVGHLPGQSLLALARSGLDSQGRIIGAQGKQPVLRNVSPQAVDHFRRTVEVIDLVGTVDLSRILNVVQACLERNSEGVEPFDSKRLLTPIQGCLPQRPILDPAGYFVIYVDEKEQVLSLEHYQKDGLLDAIIQGKTGAELYVPAIDKGLVSRLDHAAYLGCELARAEHCLLSGVPYRQDAAPEGGTKAAETGCSCGTSCREVPLCDMEYK